MVCSYIWAGVVETPTITLINTYKSVSLLFTITAVYIVCWMPLWLHYAGLSVPVEIRGVFLLNAVVNPFIYSVVSAMFRSDVKIVFRQIFSRLTSWHQWILRLGAVTKPFDLGRIATNSMVLCPNDMSWSKVRHWSCKQGPVLNLVVVNTEKYIYVYISSRS